MNVRVGIDCLLDEQIGSIQNARIGLVSNASGVTGNLRRTVDALLDAPAVQLTALFAPEHGFTTDVADGVAVGMMRETRTGLPVYNLYGDVKRPTAEMLADVDLLLFDIQTVGVRFFTYTTTLLNLMLVAAEHGIPLMVCDRPNPIGGIIMEGPLLADEWHSFVGPGMSGMIPLPIRHAMTIGELAQFYRDIWQIDCELTVIACQGWRHDMWFDQTGLIWVPPSPNMSKLGTAILYPGMCLLEGINLSEGRGTTLPFEVVGAPWLDGFALADHLNRLALHGVTFRPTRFTPTASKWQGQVCDGVQVHVMNRDDLRPVTVALTLINTIRQQHPEQFEWRLPHFDRLIGTDRVRRELEQGISVVELVERWAKERYAFEDARQQILIYR